jgi:hypothetical protein
MKSIEILVGYVVHTLLQARYEIEDKIRHEILWPQNALHSSHHGSVAFRKYPTQRIDRISLDIVTYNSYNIKRLNDLLI